MWGFGAPYNAAGDPDWGFGAPTPGTWNSSTLDADLGFGSPQTQRFVALVKSPTTLPDDGGEIVRLQGDWPFEGPYRVRLERQGTYYPQGVVGCFAADTTLLKGDSGMACTAIVPLRRLRFVLPPLAPGTYSIEVSWGVNWENVLIVGNTLEIVYRNRSRSTYSMRNTFPSTWSAGTRDPRLEPELSASRSEFPHGLLRGLTQAVGQEVQRLSGQPQTRLTAPLGAGHTTATVETTLGFPLSGRIFIGSALYTYTGKTASSLTGLSSTSAPGIGISAGSTVVLKL